MSWRHPGQTEPDGPDPQDRVAPRVFGRPSSKLGWVAVAAMAGAITLVIVINATATQGSAEEPEAHGVVFLAMITCLLASWVAGLVAAFRDHERSWAVLVPTLLISAVVVNEALQGLVLLFGGGE